MADSTFEATCTLIKCPLPAFMQRRITYPWHDCAHRDGSTCKLQLEMVHARAKLDDYCKHKK
jgi:hypothetical protein